VRAPQLNFSMVCYAGTYILRTVQDFVKQTASLKIYTKIFTSKGRKGGGYEIEVTDRQSSGRKISTGKEEREEQDSG